MLKDKYNIIEIKEKHYYMFDFEKRNFFLEGTVPYRFEIDNYRIYVHSWGCLLEKVVNYLINKLGLTKEQLLKFNLKWTNRPFFILNKTLFAHKNIIINHVYIDTNHTSIHCGFILQDFLKWNNIFYTSLELLYIKYPGYENKEVRDYYHIKSTKNFLNFLYTNYMYSDQEAKETLNIINNIDKYFCLKFKTQYSLLLFEDKLKFSNIKSSFIKLLKKKHFLNDDELVLVLEILNILTKFYATYY